MTTTTLRPLRFGFTGGASSKRAKLLDSARRPEEHLSDFADRIAMVTERMGGARPEVLAPLIARLAAS